MTPRMLLPLITLIMLQACSHIPSPRDLSFDLPERWFGAPAKLDDKKDQAQTQDPTLSLEEELRGWWLYFNDETLNHLIELALKDSPTRAIAQARILRPAANRVRCKRPSSRRSTPVAQSAVRIPA